MFLPYRYMQAHDELPHSWDVTSDTIAAWVACRLRARLIKVTDVDGIYINGALISRIYARELTGESCIDAALPAFLMDAGLDCQIVNGNCPDLLIRALEGEETGTLIIGMNRR